MYLPTLLTSFKTRDYLDLPGLLFLPKNKTKKVFIFIHGNGTADVFKNIEKLEIYAKKLHEKDIAFFTFNNRGAHLINKFRYKDKKGMKHQVEAGSTYEVLSESVLDIDAAIKYLATMGFTTFYLAGESTGANKIVVYNHYKKQNKIAKYILFAGGDDTGIMYETLGKDEFLELLQISKEKIASGNGKELIPFDRLNGVFLSYQSYFDMCNPDGDYNSFPYREYFQKLNLAKRQPLFSQFSEIIKPTLMIYGEKDEYMCQDFKAVKNVLLEKSSKKAALTVEIIKDADHRFTGSINQLLSCVTSWI